MNPNINGSGPNLDDHRDEADAAQSRPQTPAPVGEGARSLDVEAELVDVRDRWMRAEAEIANIRSRAKREVDDARRYAVQKFATDVVEAAENLKRGLDNIPPASKSEPDIVSKLRDGFTGIERSFIGLLARNGVLKEDPTGSIFDPKYHQAMSEAVSSTQKPGTVLQALSATWTLNGRLLRPAMVIVAKAAEATERTFER